MFSNQAIVNAALKDKEAYVREVVPRCAYCYNK